MLETSQNLLDKTPYRALAALGRGGMGSVHLAEHRVLKKRVAVKLLHFGLAADPGLVDRLRVEAEVLASLSSPHVVQVFDCGVTATGEPFIAMELLSGRSLQEELKARGSFPQRDAVDLVRQANKGVMAAHALGIIHRDLKPANLFYTQPDPAEPALIKVLDFGVAKIVRGPVAPRRVATAAGTIVGSAKTISPEACRGERVDARSDLYSLGVVLYMLLTGRGPFGGRKSFIDYARAHATERPLPPSAHTSQSIAPELDALVLKLLEKDPDRRVQTAAELDTELARMLETMAPASERPAPDAAEDTAQTVLRIQTLRDALRCEDTPPTKVAPRRAPHDRSANASPLRVIVTPPPSSLGARSDAPAVSRRRRVCNALLASLVVLGVGLTGYVVGKRTTPSVAPPEPSMPSNAAEPAFAPSTARATNMPESSPPTDAIGAPTLTCPPSASNVAARPAKLPATPKRASRPNPVPAAPPTKVAVSEFYE